MAPPGTGNGTITPRAIVGALWGVTMALAGIAWAGHDTRIAAIEANASPPARERLAAIEADVRAVNAHLTDIKQQLIRIEARQTRREEAAP